MLLRNIRYGPRFWRRDGAARTSAPSVPPCLNAGYRDTEEQQSSRTELDHTDIKNSDMEDQKVKWSRTTGFAG